MDDIPHATDSTVDLIHSFDCRVSSNQGRGIIEREQVSLFDKIKRSWTKTFGSSSESRPPLRSKCGCEGTVLPTDAGTCTKAITWIQLFYSAEKIARLQEEYDDLLKMVDSSLDEEQARTIQNDMDRTFGNAKFLDKQALRRILSVYSVVDPSVGYVQGMSFIVGSLLYHAEEHIAFFLFETILGRIEMRDIYSDCKKQLRKRKELPGVTKHCVMVMKLLREFLPALHAWFIDQNMAPELFCSPWLFSLFNVIIPLKHSGIFFDFYFSQKWTYFYKLVLQILDEFEEELLSIEFNEILKFFTQKKIRFIDEAQTEQEDIDWNRILTEAALIKLNAHSIDLILDSFDNESKQFKFSEKFLSNITKYPISNS